MKKLFTILALMLVTVIMAVTAAGCTDTATIDNLTANIDELTERIEALEQENEDITKKHSNLQNQVNSLNVFWTGKKEYSATESMTVYYGYTAVFKIRLAECKWSAGGVFNGNMSYIHCKFYLTSLCADILRDSIVSTTYFSWDSGTFLRDSYDSTIIAKQGVELLVQGYYKGDGTESAYNNATYFDFVVCVPGTPYELARFKNVTVNK